jgi:hypothetical protein
VFSFSVAGEAGAESTAAVASLADTHRAEGAGEQAEVEAAYYATHDYDDLVDALVEVGLTALD